ncbi:MAG: M18 family aminopeptidase [Tissierellia bacterium]|nr:M18 family aminopeptidase [Tissierellia bacterium]
MNKSNFSTGMINFIDKSPSMFHVTNNVIEKLKHNNYVELDPRDDWVLSKNGKYFVTNYGEGLIAFDTGECPVKNGFCIIGSHIDSPGFRVKSDSKIISEKHYVKLNTEVYGGPILSTWYDRPLSIAGRAVIDNKENNNIEVKLFNIDHNTLVIPQLAIHMNREVNSGVNINPQNDTLPLMTLNCDFNLEMAIANSINCNADEILSFDAYLYDRQPGCVIGAENELIQVGKLDNLAMVYSSLEALINSKPTAGIKVIAMFNNEEIGSLTNSGAASPWLKDTLTRIIIGLGYNVENFYQAIYNSFMISADQAHAVHPNAVDKHDPTHRPVMGKGPVIKVAANQSYTSNAVTIGHLKNIASINDIPIQLFYNKSDVKGGSTIGPINTGQLNMASIDIGNPLLAMHSIRELGSIKDNDLMLKLLVSLLESDNKRPRL